MSQVGSTTSTAAANPAEKHINKLNLTSLLDGVSPGNFVFLATQTLEELDAAADRDPAAIEQAIALKLHIDLANAAKESA